LEEESKRIGNKHGHICVRFFLTPVPPWPRSATITSTKDGFATLKKDETSDYRVSTFGLTTKERNALAIVPPHG